MSTLYDSRELNGEGEIKHRDCDDMLARRLSGNIPPNKKKLTDSHKQFITPTGNPMQYVQQHKKSQTKNEVEDEKAAKERERDERNTRYEEMETLKDMLKEEETQWTSKLDNWKQRRRSATFDVRQRSEERRSITIHQTETATPRRRAKTYREIVEDKKRRDAGIESTSSFDFSTDEDSLYERANTKKPYRGAVSVPTIKLRKNDIADSITQRGTNELPSEKENNLPAKNSDFLQDTSSVQNTASLPNVAPDIEKVTRVSASEQQFSHLNSNQSNNNNFGVNRFTAPPNHTVKKPIASHITPAQSIPAQHSLPNTSESTESDSSPVQQVGFANRRNMWENISAAKQANKPLRSIPIDLSSLLRRDDEKLQMNGTSSQSSAHSDACSQTSSDSHVEQLSKPTDNEEVNHFVHKPKIMGLGYNATDTAVARQDLAHSQHAFEPIHKYGNTPVIRGSLSSTLPSKPRISSLEEKMKQIEQENSLRLNISGLKGPAFTPRRSPRSGTTSLDAMFEDLNISINQRPKCEKGFGFTVRGGDDGKPVVVNTVSPGGAADHCHLRVGDEILSINKVRLSDALSQDDIVQLIVESVITGSLSLAVRRYGKSKKTTPRPFPGGFKTSGGLLPIRPKKDNFSTIKHSANNGKNETQDPPPSDQRLGYSNHSEPEFVPAPQNKAKPPRDSLFRNQTMTSQSGNGNLFLGKENKRGGFTSGVGKFKNGSYPYNSQKHKPLNVVVKEWSLLPQEAQQTNAKTTQEPLTSQVDSREEAKREEEKKKRIEEALAEERRITAQLKKIEAAKLEQGRRHEENKRKHLISESPLYNRFFNKPSRLRDGSERTGNTINDNNLSNLVNRTSHERSQP